MSPRASVRRPRGWFPAVSALCAAVVWLSPTTTLAGPVRPVEVARSAAPLALRADGGLEAQFVSSINNLRASKGLRQLSVSSELVGVARGWTDRMVAAGEISHNPALGSSVGGAWTKLGENVGVGYDVGGLMQAFINSPAHYRNLVDPDWTQVGVGVTVAADGRIYTTHNFMAIASSPPPAAPPVPAVAPAAAPTTTTTTTAAPPPPPPPAPPAPHPSSARVTAVLDPLRSLEGA